ncbi:NHLP bacteriocin export ABC transporter permease/ATPase subunit [Egbenema bharatensis]|uniref:NHLP bacteriocin export ABC transporter permease/ATPase subunit n=1 Tax=Egbenema bharatensis TaxID=3463334 RepID=UPI003A861A33
MKHMQTAETKLHPIYGNEPLLLNDPQQIWLVQSGSLALFTVQVNQGVIKGDRRYLFSIYSGEALFGIALDPAREQAGIIAVPLEPTQLLPIPIEQGITIESPYLLEQWIHKFGQVNGLPQPQPIDLSPSIQYLSLLKGQVLQPPTYQVWWIRIQQGQAKWLGHPNLLLDQDTPCVPLGNGMCLEAADDCLELYVRGTAEVANWTILVNGLAQFHNYFLSYLQSIREQEMQAALLQFHSQQQFNHQVTQQTLRNLVSILQPQTNQWFESESPLLIAAGAVGKALGVPICPPGKSEDLNRLKEPLEAIARASRLRLRRVLLRDGWWQKDGGPILAYTSGDRHPVALLPGGHTGYQLCVPAQTDFIKSDGVPPPGHSTHPSRIPVNAAVAHTLDPVAFVFYRPLPDGWTNAMSLLRFTLQGRKRDIITLLLTGVAATLVAMLVPQGTALLVDRAIPYGNSGLLLQVGLGLLAAAFGGASFQLAQAIATLRIESSSDATLQAAVWDRLLKLKTTFFRQYAIGDLNSRVSGIGAIRRKLSGTALQTIFTSFFALLNLGLLFYYSSELANLAIVLALAVLVFTTISGSLLIRKNRPLMEIEGEIFGLMVQLINAVPKLRVAGVEERAFAYWGQKYTQQLQLLRSTQQLEDAVNLFNTVMPTITMVALFWVASSLMDGNGTTLSAGTFLAFSVAFGIFISGVTNLSNTLIEVLDVIPLWQRSQPILAAQPEVVEHQANPGRLSGKIHIDRVSFRYREEGVLNLDEVSIEAQPGEFIALVGPSGSGKSTILRLLLGFEAPMSGTVYYDGQDLMGLDVTAVRRQLGVVLQNSRINAGSIFENIAGGALITLDEAWTAAEMSGFADDIRAMPMQMHTLVSEGGTNLSGGQRQRLIIARALALKPQILLFDEATSALDNKTQAIVSHSLDQLKVTRVVIAHRLSTIHHADRIYVLQAGRVVQQGNFEQLVKQPGLFAQLVRRQVV